jgi:TRAP transporter 4TM/12TM fusion protein
MTTAARLGETELQKLEAELDPEMQFRPLLPSAAWLVAALLLGLSLFHYYTAGFGLLPETTHRGVHMALVVGLIFLVFPAIGGKAAGAAPLAGLAALIIGAVLLGIAGLDLLLAGLPLLAPSLGSRAFLPPGVIAPLVIAGTLAMLVSSLTTSRTRSEQTGLAAPFGIGLADWALLIGAAFTSLYVPWIFHDLQFRVGNPLLVDWVMGTICLIVVLEACRRSVGLALPIIAMVLMVYAYFGPRLPGFLAHAGNDWKTIVNHLYLTINGVYGVALGVVATYVFHYVLFGVLATRVGLGRFFIDLATALAGRFSGGPAKVSIFASGLFGMISGSSIANTVTVGSLTIPMMIRIGYPRHFAGAVESTAATGGQITPPIMGAAAFLMVEFLGVSYQTIILAAIVPAFMHFFGVFCQVHFEARKLGLRALSGDELPKVGEVLRRDWPTSIPLVVLLLILFSGFTPYLAAFWGITACIVIGLTDRNPFVAVGFLVLVTAVTAMGQITEPLGLTVVIAASLAVAAWGVLTQAGGMERLIGIVDAFVLGAKYAISVGAAAATVGIIVGVVTLTGVGLKLSGIITGAATGLAGLTVAIAPFTADPKALALFYTLVMTAIVCILLGTGVPTTATYIMMVTIAAPALAIMGVQPIVAHFFVFYYGVLADITPPVALAAYAGASMAAADPFKTGNTAFRLGLAKALVPFVFVYSPAMLIVTRGFTWAEFWETTIGCTVGIVMLAAALTGFAMTHLRSWERLVLFAASVLVITPSRTLTLIGLALAAPIVLLQIATSRRAATAS